MSRRKPEKFLTAQMKVPPSKKPAGSLFFSLAFAPRAQKVYVWTHIAKNVDVAIRWLTASAEQNNQYAQYTLGKLYLLGENVLKDVGAAIRWLTASAEQGNQYAQYALGKLYLEGRDVPRDREAAIRWLTRSAAQGNIYARFFLDHSDSFRDPSLFLAATRLLHHLSRIFREEQERLPGGPRIQVESKLRQKIRQKKIAQGHAPDDHEQKLITY